MPPHSAGARCRDASRPRLADKTLTPGGRHRLTAGAHKSPMALNCVATKSQVPAYALPGDIYYDNSTGEVHIAIAGGLVVPLLGFLTGKHECGRPGRDGVQGATGL